MNIFEYFAELEKKSKKLYEIANTARGKGLGPELCVETALAKDLAERVETLVGPKNVGNRIRELLKEKISREKVAFEIVKEIIDGKFGFFKSNEEIAEQCLKTAAAILTEAVVAGSIDGIAKTKIGENIDGSKYLSIYFAGPIRSSGGTAQVQIAIMGDYIRKLMGLENYRPTETEIERYVEEINLYQNLAGARQYRITDDEIRHIIKNCPICINGEPTEELEVSIYKNLSRVETNRVRGGMCLVIVEGIAQKAVKALRFSKKYDLGWAWLEGLIKIKKKTEEDKTTPTAKYLTDIVGGRPIFSYPSLAGGFRLRYGRSRNSGIASKCIHPATMIILDEFLAVGTQIKIERPGKGAAISPCDTIEPPIVRLKNGDVISVDSVEKAKNVSNKIEEILFLGDILIAYGDFLESNEKLLPSCFCEEWWELLLKEKGIEIDSDKVDAEKAIQISEKYSVPLHPKYTYFYGDITAEELVKLINWLAKGDLEKIEGLGEKNIIRLILNMSPEKRILEKLCVPHRVVEGKIIIDEPMALLKTLSNKALPEISKKTALEIINEIAPFPVMNKAPTYIGARMGRPEQAKERLMSPAPHALIPVGEYGGKTRSVMKASENEKILIEVPNFICPKCKEQVFAYKCEKCGERPLLFNVCLNCGKLNQQKFCEYCGSTALPYHKTVINIKKELEKSSNKINEKIPVHLKGVIGTNNAKRCFEVLEKGILRAKHNVHVFKDGTSRFDATNLPLTHFKPYEIGTSIEKLKTLGYEKDYLGNELKEENQILELKPQDVIISEYGAKNLINTAKFVDDLLEKFYKMQRFYNVDKKEDLVSHLVMGLAPHTFVGVLGRIIGFTHARVNYAHPYFHTAKRRDCDGDEDSVMLLLDVFLNFSKNYLPERRGSSMDTPQILTIKLDPEEVGKEVYAMETVEKYSKEFYDDTLKEINPAEVKISTVQNKLGKEDHYENFNFTHNTKKIDAGPNFSRYVQLKTMEEKVDSELALVEKIRAVDQKDVAARILNFHFLRDIYGNLRAFGQQKVRCVDCNARYRRVPLPGKCTKCGGKLLLTVNKGGIEKYLRISRQIAEKYGLSDYLKQRLALIEKDLEMMFPPEKEVQQSLVTFM